MNATTRERLGGALAHLTDGVAALQALAADEDADLLVSERQALAKALEPLMKAVGGVAAISYHGEQRPPARGKVAAAPAAPEAPQEAAVAPVAPVADRGVALGLRGLALAIRDAAMAARDHADAIRELASSRPQAPPAPPAPAAAPEPAAAPADPPAGAAKPRNRRSGPPPGLRSGAVAEALGVPVSALQLQVKKQGGPQVGVTVGDWRVVEVTHGPGGRARLWWQQIEVEQEAA